MALSYTRRRLTLHWLTLSNGKQVCFANKREGTEQALAQVAFYFRHGIAVRAHDAIVDVGANVGLFALVASNWGVMPVRVFAFEPTPATFRALQANADRYGLQARLFQKAVSRASAARVTFHYYPAMSVMSSLQAYDPSSPTLHDGFLGVFDQLSPARPFRHSPRWVKRAFVFAMLRFVFRPKRIECETVTLSDVIDAEVMGRIDVLKIDVEREEENVLAGIRPDHWPRIQRIVAEVHDEAGRLSRVCDRLSAAGFTSIQAEVEPGMDAFRVTNVYATR